MASGAPLFDFVPMSVSGPATTAAQLDTIAGTSSPAESFPVLAFDTTTVEYADFVGRLPENYGGGGITLKIMSGANTTTGTLQWAAAFRRIVDDAEDIDTSAHTYDYNTVNIGTLPSAVGEFGYDNITFTDGADMDSLAAGERFILRIRRDTGSDTAAADGWFAGVAGVET